MKLITSSLPARVNILLLSCSIAILTSCASGSKENEGDVEENVVEALAPEPYSAEYTVTGLQFDGPTELTPGWTTFILNNKSSMAHFAIIERLPDSVTVEDQQMEVAPVFQNFMDNFNGKPLSAPESGMELPAWYGNVVFLGGPGLTSPNTVSETTIYLQPGNYLMECYVKTDGIFHSYNPDPEQMGMVLGITVSGEERKTVEPEANMELLISSENGFEMNGTPQLGDNTIKVVFTDQAAYANFVGHDVHLVKLEEDGDLEEVNAWMDWTQPEGLQTPAPATFIGGVNDMPPGGVGYMNATLTPGTYAFVAEVPDPASKNLLVTFTLNESM